MAAFRKSLAGACGRTHVARNKESDMKRKKGGAGGVVKKKKKTPPGGVWTEASRRRAESDGRAPRDSAGGKRATEGAR